MNGSNKNIVVVLGMHRSGTSVITRGLKILGVELGDDLYEAGDDNPKGFWEDKNCLQINENLLQYLGSAYDALGLSPDFFEQHKSSSQFRTFMLEAVEIIRNKFNQSNLCGFKDPRTSRLLPFWKAVFDQVGCTASYIIVLRNPISVVNSLLNRNSILPEKSYFLWLEHIVSAILESKEARRVVVDYDLFMDAPKKELERIVKALSLTMPGTRSAKLREYIKEFLDDKLRHTRYQLQDLKLDQKVPTDVYQVYELARRVAEDKYEIDSDNVQQTLENVQKRLNDFAPAFYLSRSLESQIEDLYHTIADRDGKIQELNGLVLGQDTQVAGLNQSLSERDSQITELNQSLSERDAQIAGLNQSLSERDAQITELNQELTNYISHITDLDQQTSDLNDQISVLKKQIETVTTTAKQENENSQQVLSQTQRELDSIQQAYQQQIELLQQRDSELHLVFTSKSWRLTAPLRVFRRVLFTHPYRAFRRNLSVSIRSLWHRAPLSPTQKYILKSNVFRSLPSFLGWTQAYRVWVESERQQAVTKGVATNSNYQSVTDAMEQDLSSPVPLLEASPLDDPPVRLIAFYLPQFHPIPENDEWWGEGFTEWTNVRPAMPQFKGHYQPRVPGELGYYDLRDTAVQKQQVELAKLYGVNGFCFYFYWFGGKRLLETPVLNYLNDSSLELPFCLCWANENWSRRWDGLDSEILIAQQHSSNDDLAFIEYVSRYLHDPRYIRIDGRPLVLVYRPSLLPSAKKTAERWRNWCRENGIGEIYLAYTQSFEMVDPSEYGFDAAVEFPPNNSGPPVITDQMDQLDPEFSGIVYDWNIFLERSINYQQPGYTLFRGVTPSWDNTSRRKSESTIFANNSPDGYKVWLSRTIKDTLSHRNKQSERLVFVNAWNEWAEGAYLEPDQRYGYAYLQATRDALEAAAPAECGSRVVLVGHDAHPHGAQTLLLYMTRMLVKELGFRVDIVLLGDGPLLSEYEALAQVHLLQGNRDIEKEGSRLAERLYADGIRSAITNTAVSGHFAAILKQVGFTVVSLIHELPGVIEQYQLQSHVAAIANNADHVVFPAQQVMDGFETYSKLTDGQSVIRPQGVFRTNGYRARCDIKTARKELRDKFGLPENAQIVLSIGYADPRKGIDLFVESGIRLLKSIDNVYFIWVGHFDSTIEPDIRKKVSESESSDHFIFPGLDFDADRYYAGADVYALTSREDPFPCVVLEALDAALPIVAFEGAGGFCDLLGRGGGVLIPAFDLGKYVNAIAELLDKKEVAQLLGESGRKIVKDEFSFRRYVFDIAALADATIHRVSVVVPNYNYGHYLHSRITSIIEQSYPIYELIILDDQSSDNSRQLIDEYVEKSVIDCIVIYNEVNSGSPFKQWLAGVGQAKGDLVWIAEADDLSNKQFLNEVQKPFDDASVVMSYCQSKQINSKGCSIAEDYLDYTSDISLQRWKENYVENGLNETSNCLAIKNTIPNVSAVLFRADVLYGVLKEGIKEITTYRVAGDWLTYIYVLENGKIAYSPAPLNYHRRHDDSVTLSSFDISQLKEILAVQKYVRDTYDLSDIVQKKADAYIQKLYQEFNLQTTSAVLWDKHPELLKFREAT